MSVTLQESYRHCRKVACRASSSFPWTFRLLPAHKRRAMHSLYAFSRYSDDLADREASAAQRAASLAAWRAALQQAFEGRTGNNLLLPAVVETTTVFDIPQRYLFDIIDGVAMDVGPVRYETFDDLCRYCYHVASAVGLACIHIWGFQTSRAPSLAVRCGYAFQLTNILRDICQDARCGRVYLPHEDLQRFECTVNELAAAEANDRLRQLMRFEIERTESLYDEAAMLGDHLHEDGRRIFRLMYRTYRTLLENIKRRDGDVWSRPVRLTTWQRIHLASRLMIPGRPHFRYSQGGQTGSPSGGDAVRLP